MWRSLDSLDTRYRDIFVAVRKLSFEKRVITIIVKRMYLKTKKL